MKKSGVMGFVNAYHRQSVKGVMTLFLIIFTLVNAQTITTIPPVPLTIEITYNATTWQTTVLGEKAIDILEVQYPGCSINRLYQQNALYKKWFESSSTKSTRGRSLSNALSWDYHNHAELTAELRSLHERFANITKLTSIGTSASGKELWVLAIVTPVAASVPKPKMKWVGNMHGDETVGRELLLHLIDELLTRYTQGDTRIVTILHNVDVYIMPTMNPDGYEIGWRNNKNNIDLNRNFPDQFRPGQGGTIQPETRAIMDWVANTRFTLAGNMHGGSLVASYGYDGVPKGTYTSGLYSAAPDDKLLQHLSHIYADNHKQMPYKLTNPEFGGSPHYGITNGAYWYALYGGMPDYTYLYGKCPDVTFEISVVKNPPKDTLQQFWNDNLESILAFTEQAFKIAVGGYIYDQQSNQRLNGTEVAIRVSSIDYSLTTSDGSYIRLLAPDVVFNITASADGYLSKTVCNVVVTSPESRESIIRLDFELEASGDKSAVQSTGCDSYYEINDPSQIANNSHRTTASIFYSLFVSLLVVLLSIYAL